MRLNAAIGGLSVLASSQFWSFRVVHALLGGLLTVGGATGALVVGDSLRKEATIIDSRVASMTARLDSIRTTLAQFRVVQSNGALLGALASGGTLADDYREQFVQLMFVLRRGPDVAVLGELHLADVDAFDKERDELDRLIAVAVSPERTSQSWNDVADLRDVARAAAHESADRVRDAAHGVAGRPQTHRCVDRFHDLHRASSSSSWVSW